MPDETQRRSSARQANRTQMILIGLIGFVTLGGSYALFYVAHNSDDWPTTNNGIFVDPPITIEQLGWHVEGERRRWWVWTVAATCETICQAAVKDMRALHTLLNTDADRVRRAYTGATVSDGFRDYPDLARVTVTDPGALADGVYIIDPNGNLVFYYPLNTDPGPVLQDLKKLLKISQIG